MSSRNDADITAIVGATGSGKSLQIKHALARKAPRRLLIWDPMREYGSAGDVLSEVVPLVSMVSAAGAGPFRAVFWPHADAGMAARQFDVVCELAFAAGRVTLIAEELAGVTRAGWAPAGWLRVVTQGRHAGLRVIGTTQRPQLVDKTFLDNTTTIRCGRLNTQAGRRYMADLLDVSPDDIAQLRPLQWISKAMATGKVTRETVSAS